MDSPAAPYRRGGQSSRGVAAATGAINASPLESLIPALSSLHTPVRGEVDDTSCNVEEVERANSQQVGRGYIQCCLAYTAFQSQSLSLSLMFMSHLVPCSF